MSLKKILKEDVETVLLSLHKKIDSLSKKVEALCQSTHGCTPPPNEKENQKDKK
jgi:hypothetical protein